MLSILGWLIWTLLALKALEIFYHTILILRWKPEIHSLTNDWPVSRIVNRICPAALFRLPALIPAIALLLTVGDLSQLFSICGGILVVFTIWIELFQTLLSRLRYGYQDIHFRRQSVAITGYTSSLDNREHHDLVRAFVLFVASFVLLAIIGYSGVYAALDRFDCEAFTGTLNGAADCLYFSTVTFATVGYGDIAPVSQLARIITTSEILISLGSLVLLVLAYSSTALGPPDNSH